VTRPFLPGIHLALGLCLIMATAARADGAKVLLYHHVSSDTPASTSVTPETFDAHLELIASEGYTVVPLSRIVDALINGDTLDSRWVAFTFDDAYESVASAAAPRLAARGWPFTVFVSTDLVDSGAERILDWEGLRALEAAGATLANHTLSHEHMVRRHEGETEDDWLKRLGREVMGAQARLEAELEDPLRLFAYPYGEFTAEVAHLMQSLGFIAFGQQSGPVGSTSSPYAIPRFPLARGFDSVESLAEKLRTEHLPLVDPQTPATLLAADAGAPVLDLTVAESAGLRPGTMTCFIGGQPKTEVVWKDGGKIQVRAERSLSAGRTKYTCTAPHPDVPRAYYWHTHLYIRPHPDGSWYSG
jgi:biofilm PGA synthesis lipoprotein PgaB